MNRVLFSLILLCSGCFSSTIKELDPKVRRHVLCVEEIACKRALAKDCTKGGTIYGAVPAVVVEYSCNP